MDCSRQPMLSWYFLILLPKFLQLIWVSLGDQALVVYFFPETGFLHMTFVAGIHYVEHFYSFNNCKLFFSSYIQLSTFFITIFKKEIIILDLKQIFTDKLYRILLIISYVIFYPRADINVSPVEIFELKLFIIYWLQLKCVALALIYHYSSILCYQIFQFF